MRKESRLQQKVKKEVLARSIEALKKELYEKMKAQVSDRLGLQDREILKSQKAFQSFFSKSWKASSRRHLLQRIKASDLIFWGDFHGVRQFQNNVLRWLKKVDLSKRPVVLALEVLGSHQQKWVDQYLQGDLSEEVFLEKVKWNQNWGFPWIYYQPLFRWARENKQVLRVINAPGRHVSSSKREEWGVRQIREIRETYPEGQIFVLYGEYHLLPQGFPRWLKKNRLNSRTLYIFQNSESLYFRFQKKKIHIEGEIFKKSEQFFCLQNVSPWVKWQNYHLFLESQADSDMEDDFDFTEHIVKLSEVLSKTLQLPFNSNRYSVFTAEDRALWEHLKKLPDSEFSFFEALVEEGMSFVHPDGDWAFLGRISANEVASLAMQTLIFQYNPRLRWTAGEEILEISKIWIYSLSYFGSKLVNPHRKTPSLLDLQKKSRSLSVRPLERQAARVALHYLLRQSLGESLNLNRQPASQALHFQALRWVAGLWGEKIYNAYSQKGLSLKILKSFLAKNPRDPQFQVVFQDFYELIEEF